MAEGVARIKSIMQDYLEITVDKFIFRVAIGCWYNSEGVWAIERGGVVRTGLSDFLQQRSGDIAFAEVKPVGTVLAGGDEIATIETIKVNITLSSPVSGKIIRVNPQLETTPEVINQDPYGEGWLCEIEPEHWLADRADLVTAEAYFARMKREAEEEAKRS
jgi:glycine cleavage system H protein